MANNMNLHLIEKSEPLTPDNINANFSKLDVLGTDYVIESGMKGSWWYQKFKSGRLYCGIDNRNFGNQKLEKAWGTVVYRTPYLSWGAYPITFATKPHVDIGFNGDRNSATRTSWAVAQNTTSATQAPKFIICDFVSNDLNPDCSIFVCGRYK